MSALYLIRHAQAGPRHKYDQLSDLGQAQARHLGEYLAAQPVSFTAAFAGGLARQRLTAEAVARAYRDRSVPFPDIQHDPRWNDCIPFHEYFHGDTGAGVGASHQTGWTGLIAKLIEQSGGLS